MARFEAKRKESLSLVGRLPLLLAVAPHKDAATRIGYKRFALPLTICRNSRFNHHSMPVLFNLAMLDIKAATSSSSSSLSSGFTVCFSVTPRTGDDVNRICAKCVHTLATG